MQVSDMIQSWLAKSNVNNKYGAANVSIKNGTGETTKNRELGSLALNYAEATNTFTHTEVDNVTEVVLTFSMANDTAIPLGTNVKWTADQPNAAADQAVFAQVGTIDGDVDFGRIYLDGGYEYRITFVDYLTRMSFEPSIAGLRVTALNQ